MTDSAYCVECGAPIVYDLVSKCWPVHVCGVPSPRETLRLVRTNKVITLPEGKRRRYNKAKLRALFDTYQNLMSINPNPREAHDAIVTDLIDHAVELGII